MIAVLLAVVCTFGVIIAYTSMASTYGITPMNPKYTQTFDQMNKTMAISEEMSDIVTQLDLGDKILIEAGIDLFSAAFKIGWKTIKLTFSTVGIMHVMIVDSAEIIGIPSFFVTVFLAIIVIAVLFMLLSIIFKWQVSE